MNDSMDALNLSLVLIGNSLQRIAAGASGVLAGLYLAELANRGSAVGAGLVGVLGTVSFAAPLLAHLTDVSDHKPSLRAKAMSYFELSLLAGLALGGLLAGQLWGKLGTRAFGEIALVYLF